MATNRHDTLDPALLRPGRLDRKIEFPLPDRRQKRLIFSTITGKMNLSEEVDLEDCILDFSYKNSSMSVLSSVAVVSQLAKVIRLTCTMKTFPWLFSEVFCCCAAAPNDSLFLVVYLFQVQSTY